VPASYNIGSRTDILFATADPATTDDNTPLASNNIVTVDFSTAQSPYYVFGGIGGVENAFNGSISVENNTVYLKSGTVTDYLVGGWGYGTLATLPVYTVGNTVEITGARLAVMFGGYARNTAGRATVTDNIVSISAGTVSGTIFGGTVAILLGFAALPPTYAGLWLKKFSV
jgi:hypothetical protein